MRVAVTGRHGQVARSLQERSAFANIEVTSVARPDVDLLNPSQVHAALIALRPDAIVNAAAYTAVDLAEDEAALARQINVDGAAAVAAAAASLGIPLVQLSTDYVFDGTLNRPYREDDGTNPISAYGLTKLEGETAIAAVADNHAILRTAWIYSPFGKNFVRTMLQLANTHEAVSVVCDQWGTPTNALDIADGILLMVRNLIERPSASELRGVFHMTAGGDTNWADFAEEIFKNSRTAGGPSARVLAIPASDYPARARRPANSRLDNTRLKENHGVQLPRWQKSLGACVARLCRDIIQESQT